MRTVNAEALRTYERSRKAYRNIYNSEEYCREVALEQAIEGSDDRPWDELIQSIESHEERMDDSMDGEHASALESVYGPEDY